MCLFSITENRLDDKMLLTFQNLNQGCMASSVQTACNLLRVRSTIGLVMVMLPGAGVS
jgi:hypothetical protein